MNMVEKNRTKQEYRDEIEVLKVKLDMRKTNLQLNLANRRNHIMIFMALLAGIAIPIFFAFGFKLFFIAAIILSVIWLIPSLKRAKLINEDRIKIFCIFSEMSQTYEDGLRVNINEMDKILKIRTKEGLEVMNQMVENS